MCEWILSTIVMRIIICMCSGFSAVEDCHHWIQYNKLAVHQAGDGGWMMPEVVGGCWLEVGGRLAVVPLVLRCHWTDDRHPADLRATLERWCHWSCGVGVGVGR